MSYITENQLNESQKTCLLSLLEWYRDKDGKNISVIASPGYGKNTVSYVFAEKIPESTVLFLSQGGAAADRITTEVAPLLPNIRSMSVAAAIRDKDAFSDVDVVVLHNLYFDARRRLYEILPRGIRVASFVTAGQEMAIDADKDFSTKNAIYDKQLITYRTGRLIDIRDVLFASGMDKMLIDCQLLSEKCRYEEKKNALLQAACEDKDREIQSLNRTIDFLDGLLKCVGVPTEELAEYTSRLNDAKARADAMEDGIESEAIVERVACEIFEAARKKHANSVATETCEKMLIDDLGLKTWNKLDKLTRSYLISARFDYESMIKVDDNGLMDYSGVCLLITKSVELEASKRFFDGYKRYLMRRFGTSYNMWPNSMTEVDKRTGATMPASIFTLGSFIYIVKTGWTSISPIFLDYAMSELFVGLPVSEVSGELLRNCDFIEKLRVDYRNPAAHTGSLRKVGAAKCFEYVIEVEKMLRKMIEKMKY